ncbi:MAG: aldehyde ferredoxin oxidoreductase family protein [Methanosarcinales archaeon]|nr:aldehyde ferredoxin oxidoreductase family protein [Methanosarcinales archaeon]
MNHPDNLLRIYLDSGKTNREPIPRTLLRTFMGGKGLAAHYLYNENPPGCDALSPDNLLAIMNGPLTGAPVTNGVNFSVCAKSPLTGTWNDSHCNGWWGPELRYAGYMGLLIMGRSQSPVYINIIDDRVEILDATDLWGMDTFAVQAELKARHSPDREARVLSIGPAGERMAKLAGVFAENRTAARGGLGAVMGSKRLKAVVVTGHGKYEPSDPVTFRSVRERINGKVRNSSGVGNLRKMGTAELVEVVNETGGWSTRNYTSGQDDVLCERLDGFAIKDQLWDGGARRRPCPGCAIQCSHLAVVQEGQYRGLTHDGPEFESITLLGSNCGIDDSAVVTVAEHLCDTYGLDSMSTGSTIAFLMECYERGLIRKEDTGGLELMFGNSDALIEVIHMMGRGDGPLAFAAHGTRDAALGIGQGSVDFAMNVKGLEIPAYLPRTAKGQALAYAVSDRGACHLRPWTYGKEVLGRGGRFDPMVTAGKGKMVWDGQQRNAIYDSAGICKFITYAAGLDELHELFAAATGFTMDRSEFDLLGRRVAVLTRAFNNREGFDRRHDTLPARVTTQGERPVTGAELDAMLDEYYDAAGFTQEGMVPESLLVELGIQSKNNS